MRDTLNGLYRRKKIGDVSLWADDSIVNQQLVGQIRQFWREDFSGPEILKASPRRKIVRLPHSATAAGSIVLKGFPLKKLESRIKYKKYGLTEFLNYMRLKGSGIPAPTCYGYFEVRMYGLVRANGVLIQDFPDHLSIHDALSKAAERRLELLLRAIPLLSELFSLGINHIDVTPQNLLLSPDEKNLCLIDWQYCSFVEPRSTPQLLLQAAHFLRYAEEPSHQPVWNAWLAELHRASGIDLPSSVFLDAVSWLQERPRLSSTERLALGLGGMPPSILGK